MSEINNSINNVYGFIPASGIDDKKNKKKKHDIEVPLEAQESSRVPDTGVLGRSQVIAPRGGNIKLTIDEACRLAEHSPVKMRCSEMMFDNLYKNYLEQGLSESDAYYRALMGEQEFLDAAANICR